MNTARFRTQVLLLIVLGSLSHGTAAQSAPVPQVVIEAASPEALPAPIPSPDTGIAAPSVVIPATPVAEAAETPAAAATPAPPPAFTSPTVTIQNNPTVTAPVVAAPPAPAAVIAPPSPAPLAAPQNTVAQPSAPPVTTPTPDGIGTTIFGEQETPIGLYITPWKDDYAERGLDRPARLLDEAMEPIDPATFRRQIEYYETITEFRRKQRGEAK